MTRYKNGQNFPKKVVKKEKKHSKANNKEKPSAQSNKNTSKGFYYSFLTIILLMCLIQITISAVINISKIISYKAKIVQITTTRNAAEALNRQLKDSIKNFSNVAGLEAIARNNLKMSSEDEIMVIINTPNEEQTEEKHKKFGLFKD